MVDFRLFDLDFRPRLEALLAACKAHGIDARVASGYRDRKLQAILYARFKAGGPRASPPGKSLHEQGKAADLLIFRGGQQVDDGDDPAYAEMHTIAERYGLRGLRPELHDMGHIELAP